MYDEKQMKKGTQALYPVAAEKISSIFIKKTV